MLVKPIALVLLISIAIASEDKSPGDQITSPVSKQSDPAKDLALDIVRYEDSKCEVPSEMGMPIVTINWQGSLEKENRMGMTFSCSNGNILSAKIKVIDMTIFETGNNGGCTYAKEGKSGFWAKISWSGACGGKPRDETKLEKNEVILLLEPFKDNKCTESVEPGNHLKYILDKEYQGEKKTKSSCETNNTLVYTFDDKVMFESKQEECVTAHGKHPFLRISWAGACDGLPFPIIEYREPVSTDDMSKRPKPKPLSSAPEFKAIMEQHMQRKLDLVQMKKGGTDAPNKPSDKPSNKHSDKHDDKSGDKPGPESSGNTIDVQRKLDLVQIKKSDTDDKSSNKPSDKPSNKSSNKHSDKHDDKPGDKPEPESSGKTIEVTLKLDGDYDQLVSGREELFINECTANIRRLNDNVCLTCHCENPRSGSILVDIVGPPDGSVDEIVSHVNNNGLNLDSFPALKVQTEIKDLDKGMSKGLVWGLSCIIIGGSIAIMSAGGFALWYFAYRK